MDGTIAQEKGPGVTPGPFSLSQLAELPRASGRLLRRNGGAKAGRNRRMRLRHNRRGKSESQNKCQSFHRKSPSNRATRCCVEREMGCYFPASMGRKSNSVILHSDKSRGCHAHSNEKGLGISPQALLKQKTESLLGVRERRVVGVLDLLGHGLVGRIGGIRMGNQRGGESESKNQCERFHEANS
jgi:hypothetical protein